MIYSPTTPTEPGCYPARWKLASGGWDHGAVWINEPGARPRMAIHGTGGPTQILHSCGLEFGQRINFEETAAPEAGEPTVRDLARLLLAFYTEDEVDGQELVDELARMAG